MDGIPSNASVACIPAKREQLKTNADFCRQAKAGIWPGLAYLFQVRSTAAGDERVDPIKRVRRLLFTKFTTRFHPMSNSNAFV